MHEDRCDKYKSMYNESVQGGLLCYRPLHIYLV
jgi:hypothetical protein